MSRRQRFRDMRLLPAILVCGLVIFAFGIVVCLVARGPRMQKVADCTNNVITTELTIATDPNYHLVIAVPLDRTNALSFSGEVKISEDKQTLTMGITSEDMIRCKSFGELDCYLLTWSPTNRVKLNEFLARGKKYTVSFQFQEMPPQGSSMWLRSQGRVCPGFP